MAASHKTVADVYNVIRRHLSCEDTDILLAELLAIDGNQSFKDTIKYLSEYHKHMVPKAEVIDMGDQNLIVSAPNTDPWKE